MAGSSSKGLEGLITGCGCKPWDCQPLGRNRRYHQTKNPVTTNRMLKKTMVNWTMRDFHGIREIPL